MLSQKRTGVAFRTIINNGIVKINDVTSVQIFNGPWNVVYINGMYVEKNENITLVVADGTVSDFEMNIEFVDSLPVRPMLNIIYKKIIECTP